MTEVIVKAFSKPPISKKEIIRYAGADKYDGDTNALIESVIAEARDIFSYKVCYTTLPVSVDADAVDFGIFSVVSKHLAESLKGSGRALIFAATVGVGVDRLIARYSRTSPSRALFLQALGSERVESLCNAFCHSFDSPLTPRFSPGYGDLTLDCQEKIFTILNCPKNIGLTLNDSMLMSPTKSVTAFAGIK